MALGPLAVTREGLTFGLVSAGRVLVAFLASVAFLFTTLRRRPARGARRTRREPPPRVRRPVGRPDGAADAGSSAASILEAQQARGLPIGGSFADPRCGRSCRSSGRSCSARSIDVRERTFALEARGFGARRTPDGLPGRRRPAGRPLAAAARSWSAIVAVVAWPFGRAGPGPVTRLRHCGRRARGCRARGSTASTSATRAPRARRSTASTSTSSRASRSASPAAPAPASRRWRWPRPASSRGSSGRRSRAA